MPANPDGSYTLSHGPTMWLLDNEPSHVPGRARSTMQNLNVRYTAIYARWMESISYRTLASTLSMAISARAEDGQPPINTCIVMGTGTMCGHSSPDVRNNREMLASAVHWQNVALYQIAVFHSVIRLLGKLLMHFRSG
jgi:hypothetical protein